jgi:hypothetical protein
MDDWILSNVRARCVRQVAAWAVATAIVIILVVANRRYFANFFGGPYELGQAELDAITDVSEAPKTFAVVNGSGVFDTGLRQVTRKKGPKSGRSAGWYALAVGDRLLACKSKDGQRTTYEGELKPMPVDFTKRFLDSPEVREIRDKFYPFHLETRSFRTPGWIALAAILVFATLLAWKGFAAWRYAQDPAAHPLMQRVAVWGDPASIAETAEQEARAPLIEAGGWRITETFLIQSRYFMFDVLRNSDLLWGYKKVTKNSVNFIPTGKSYEAVLQCRGGVATMGGKEKEVDEILAVAARVAPWATFGFSKEIEHEFRKNTAAFCEAVDRRKAEIRQGRRP